MASRCRSGRAASAALTRAPVSAASRPRSGATIVGNRSAYLRLGIELLKAALHPVQGAGADAPRIGPEIGYLLAEGSRSPFELWELDESIASRPPSSSTICCTMLMPRPVPGMLPELSAR